MIHRPTLIALALALTMSTFDPNLAAAAADPVATGAQVEKLAGDFKFTEGPAADKDGNVYFTDQPNDRILRVDAATGKTETFLQPAGRSNGLCFDNAGKLLACADDKNELWSIDVATKQHTVLVKDFNGKLLNGPNDLWVTPDNAVYFTDPLYRRDYWTRDPKPQQDVQAVYHLSPDRTTLKRVAEDLRQPNGIIATPDGKTLYVADIGARKTYAYDPRPDGTLANKRLFCEMGSDGMTIDDHGNVYLTGRGVTVFDKTGKKIRQIDVPKDENGKDVWTANVCFGGKDGKTLFITASKSLYAVKMVTGRAGSQ